MACCNLAGNGTEVSGVTNLEVAEAPFPLRVRKVIDVSGRAFQITELHVLAHADHHLLVESMKYVRPMGEPFREESTRHVLADNGHVLRCGSVLGVKGAAGQDGNLHGGEVPIADDVVVTSTLRFTGMPGTRMELFQLPSPNVKAEKAGRFDSRKRIDAVLDLLEKNLEAGIVVLVAGKVGVDVQAQHILLVEAGVDTVQVDERAQEETGSHHQHQRKRHLGDNKYFRQWRLAGGRSAAAAFEALHQLQARGPQSGEGPKSSAVQTVDREGEGEEAQVERDVERNGVGAREIMPNRTRFGDGLRKRCPVLRRPAPTSCSR